jgi:hypothetical protein
MGPPSYMRSVVDRNVVMRLIPVSAEAVKLLSVFCVLSCSENCPLPSFNPNTSSAKSRVPIFKASHRSPMPLNSSFQIFPIAHLWNGPARHVTNYTCCWASRLKIWAKSVKCSSKLHAFRRHYVLPLLLTFLFLPNFFLQFFPPPQNLWDKQ